SRVRAPFASVGSATIDSIGPSARKGRGPQDDKDGGCQAQLLGLGSRDPLGESTSNATDRSVRPTRALLD
ncbi:MAG: hypothetical protein WBC78_16940, partial [Candidatus Sulfotelmatobacter sp.]